MIDFETKLKELEAEFNKKHAETVEAWALYNTLPEALREKCKFVDRLSKSSPMWVKTEKHSLLEALALYDQLNTLGGVSYKESSCRAHGPKIEGSPEGKDYLFEVRHSGLELQFYGYFISVHGNVVELNIPLVEQWCKLHAASYSHTKEKWNAGHSIPKAGSFDITWASASEWGYHPANSVHYVTNREEFLNAFSK